MSDELHFSTIAETSRLIRARQLSPVEYTDALLQRIEALDLQLNAFITVTADLARKQARRAEAEIMAGDYRGPLHSLPDDTRCEIESASRLTDEDANGLDRITLGGRYAHAGNRDGHRKHPCDKARWQHQPSS